MAHIAELRERHEADAEPRWFSGVRADASREGSCTKQGGDGNATNREPTGYDG
jgi:hypothetical protein